MYAFWFKFQLLKFRFVPCYPTDNKSSLVHHWHKAGHKPLNELKLVRYLFHRSYGTVGVMCSISWTNISTGQQYILAYNKALQYLSHWVSVGSGDGLSGRALSHQINLSQKRQSVIEIMYLGMSSTKSLLFCSVLNVLCYPMCTTAHCYLYITSRQDDKKWLKHYNDAIMDAIASQITSLTIVYSTVYSGADQRKNGSSAENVSIWWRHHDMIPEQNGRQLADGISQSVLWMKSFVFSFLEIFISNVQFTISEHWFIKWVCAEQATSHIISWINNDTIFLRHVALLDHIDSTYSYSCLKFAFYM